jgi:hypothetical protein
MRNAVLAALVFGVLACSGDPETDEAEAGAAASALKRGATPSSIAKGYEFYDFDGDKNPEINSITPAPLEPTRVRTSGAAGRALVLVEARLLEAFEGARTSELLTSLGRYRDDLMLEGYQVDILVADLYHGPLHQDGLTLLALRRYLQDVYAAFPSLAGVTLVGAFPDASIMRRVLFRQPDAGGDYMVLHPERINPRADIVLADLDGYWEDVYRLRTDPSVEYLMIRPQEPWPYDGQILSGTVVSHGYTEWDDVFYLQDDFVTRLTAFQQVGDTVWLSIDYTAQRNPELSWNDLFMANPLARPEIAVSRINARHIARNPGAGPDRNGNRPLDASGRPQTVIYDEAPVWDFVPDRPLEHRILLDYFARNHAFRTGIPLWPYQVSSVHAAGSGLASATSFNDYLREADSALGAYAKEDADLLDFVDWLKEPGILRGVAAHGTGTLNEFRPPASWIDLDAAAGGKPFVWTQEWAFPGWRYRPSLEGHGGNSRWGLGRSLWENHALDGGSPAFFVLGACSANVPDNQPGISYDHELYAKLNYAETVLFFHNGLGVMARGKVFNDRPSGFGDGIAASGRFGHGWRSAFDTDAADPSLLPGTSTEAVLRNKKAYFWSALGDWTLKIEYY